LSVTTRRRIWELGNTGSLADFGGTNSGDVWRGSRERRVQVVLRAIRVGTSVSARVTRSGNEGNSTETNLLELNVDTCDVSLGINSQLLAFSSTDTVFALIFFVPAIRDGVHERKVFGSIHVDTKSIEPSVVRLNPEPTLGLKGNSENPLDVEGSLNLRVGWVVTSNDVVVGEGRDRNVELGSKRLEIVR
jgi:hypothetical protein